MASKHPVLIYILLLGMAAVWGGVFPVYRHMNVVRAQYGITSWDIVWLRFVPSMILFLPLLWMNRDEVARMLRAKLLPIIAIGMLTTSIYNVFLITGEEKVPAAVAALVVGFNPSTTFLLSVLFLGEHFTMRKLAGLLVSIMGLAYISLTGRVDDMPLDLKYVFITILAPLCWGLATIISKTVLRSFEPLTLTALSVCIGTLPLIPLPLLHGRLFSEAGNLPLSFWFETAYLVIAATVLGFLIWYKALQFLSATHTSMFVFFVPLFGVLISSFTEGISMSVLVGGAAIIFGVVITTTGAARK